MPHGKQLAQRRAQSMLGEGGRQGEGEGYTHLQQDLSGVHVGTHAQLAGHLLADQQLVTRDHLDADALAEALLDGRLGVVSGGVEQGQQALHGPGAGFPPSPPSASGHTQGTVPPLGELRDLAVHQGG